MPLLKIDIEARYTQFQDALTAIQRNTSRAGMKVMYGASNSFGDGVGRAGNR
jgi:hypothetical protein